MKRKEWKKNLFSIILRHFRLDDRHFNGCLLKNESAMHRKRIFFTSIKLHIIMVIVKKYSSFFILYFPLCISHHRNEITSSMLHDCVMHNFFPSSFLLHCLVLGVFLHFSLILDFIQLEIIGYNSYVNNFYFDRIKN